MDVETEYPMNWVLLHLKRKWISKLREKWEDLSSSFRDWLPRLRAKQFIDSVIESAREGSRVTFFLQ